LKAKTQAWYDRAMVEEGSPAMLPLDESPWLPMYEEVAQHLHVHEEVVDLGCGTGLFVKLLQRLGHYGQITGVDWSENALDVAMRYCASGPTHDDLPPVKWVAMDLDHWEPDGDRAGNTVYVCTEVLEHLTRDVELVQRIPPGHRFIFSVPNYDSESHVRTFPHISLIWGRYDHLLTFTRWALIGEERKAIHVVEARRRSDSW